jgi:hypothetical protein
MSTLPSVGEENYPTPDEVLALVLGSMQIDAARRGLEIDISPGSDHYVRAKAFSKRVSVAIANGQIARDNYNPLTATGDNLLALCALDGNCAHSRRLPLHISDRREVRDDHRREPDRVEQQQRRQRRADPSRRGWVVDEPRRWHAPHLGQRERRQSAQGLYRRKQRRHGWHRR